MDDSDRTVLDSQAETSGSPAPPPPSTGALPEVPGYRILGRLGAGGMGEVFAAEQLEPVRREVALKVIKWGMDTKEVIGRFESERQALALMDHPSIARVFEAGATASGRPYFAMEMVRGVPITDYCDRHRLPMHERLELFARVCEAVQHAHNKGIIHRDLKPSNVLVKVQDGAPVPKIIDFGLAKATAQRLTERTVFTEYGQLIGTPEYMSPEQAEMTGLDVDTRTDVYSLGAILYELMVGALPFDPRELRRATLAEIQRRIREEEPLRPSTRVSRLGEDSAMAARNRGTEPRTLAGRLKGDLDWIVMKALEKDRTRRYATADGLAVDVRRHLRNEPVLASPPSAAYRARKFVLRHTLGVAASAVVAAALVLGAAAASVGLVRARRAEQAAQREAARANAIKGFLLQTLGSASPYAGAGREITVAAALKAAAGRIGASFAGEPELEAAVREAIGETLTDLGRYDDAAALLEEALRMRRDVLDAGPADVASSLGALGGLRRGQGRLEEAGALFREALQRFEQARGPNEPAMARTLLGLADVLSEQAQFEEAEPLLRRAIALQEAAVGPADADLATSVHTLAILLARQGKLDEAEPLFRRTLAIREKALGPDHPYVATSLTDIGSVHWSRGEYADAERYFRRALDVRERALGAEHPDVASSLHNLATLFAVQGKYEPAREYYARSIAVREKAQGPDHPDLAASLGNLANIEMEQGRFAEAEALFKRTDAILERALGPDHPQVASNLDNLANLYLARGELEKAEPLYSRAIAVREKALGPRHPDVGVGLLNLASLLERRDRLDESEAASRRALGILEAGLGPEHPHVATCWRNLGVVAERRGRLDEAETLFRRALAIDEKALGAEAGPVADSLHDLANVLVRAARPGEAEPLYRRALAIREKLLVPGHPDRKAVVADYARMLRAAGRATEAAALERR